MRRALAASLLIHAVALAWLPWSSADRREPPRVRFASATLEEPAAIEPPAPDPSEPVADAAPRERFEFPLEERAAEVALPPLEPRMEPPPQVRAPVHYRIHARRPSPASTLAAPALAAPSLAAPATVAAPPTPPRVVAGEQVPPRYPSVARRRGWQGTTILELRISASGRVESVAVRQSSGYAVLDREAMRVAREWSYRPGTREGRPVAGTLLQPVEFRLR